MSKLLLVLLLQGCSAISGTNEISQCKAVVEFECHCDTDCSDLTKLKDLK